MDAYLVNIAQTYGVKWVPEPRREDLCVLFKLFVLREPLSKTRLYRLGVISEILRVDSGSSPIVDLPRLREICARGTSFLDYERHTWSEECGLKFP